IGSAPVAEIVRRCADLPLPQGRIPHDPLLLPGGTGNLTQGEGVVRATGYAAGMKNVCYSHGFDDSATARARLLRDDAGAVARIGGLLDEPIDRTVTYRHRPTESRNELTQNHGHVAFLFAAHRATVDVDLGTGLVRVVQIATAQDVGKAINPLAVIGQLEGGIAQGLGLAVMEEVQLKDGAVRNASFTDYLLPTMLDMPPVVCDLIEFPHPDAPY